MKKIAAFFDIDGTLYREGLITEVFKKMIKYEIIDAEKWYNEVRPKFLKYDNRQGDYDSYLLGMIDIYMEAIKGLDSHHIEFIAKKVIEQKGERIYTFSRDRIKWHKEQGHVLITISGSPVELVKEMSERHGFNDYKGAIYTLDNEGKYTGDVIPMWDSESKENAINYFVNKYNIDLEKSYAYGDTSGDFTMFNMVKNPYCINPTKELIQKVLNNKEVKEKINLIVERKDAVYKLKVDGFEII